MVVSLRPIYQSLKVSFVGGLGEALKRGGALCVLAAGLWPVSLSAKAKIVPVVDLHVDLSYRSLFKGKSFSKGSGQFVADELIDAGVRGVVLPLFVPHDAPPNGRSLQLLSQSYAHVFRSIVTTPPYSLPGCGVMRAGSEGRSVSTWLAFEGAGPLAGKEWEVRKWALRGVRSFGLVHSVDNKLSGSSGKSWRYNHQAPGLTESGRIFVQEVGEVGGLVDISHASDTAVEEVLTLARQSGQIVVATHSNARALAPHPRNLRDDQIRGIALSGGVVGVNFHQSFLAPRRGSRATLSDVVRQIRYIAKIGGIDGVAIGSDFEGGISAVPELANATRYQNLANALRASGMVEAHIRKVFYRNAQRVLCQKFESHRP